MLKLVTQTMIFHVVHSDMNHVCAGFSHGD
jgi:hypothetical protein